jgi:hypothetical protein
MLTRLEKNPRALFEEWELKGQDSAAFEDAKRTGLVRRLPAPHVGESYVDRSGRLLTVVANPDGTVEGIDEDDPECEPLPVEPSEVASWTVNADVLCQRFREANSLSGTSGCLHERLYLLGDLSPGRAVILAFPPDERSAVSLLMELPALASTTIREFVVAVPSLTPPPAEQRRLEALHIWVQALRPDDPFALGEGPTADQEMTAERTFSHSDDFRSFTLDGRVFSLTPRQAEVVRILLRAFRSGAPELGWPQIRSQLSSQLGVQRESLPERFIDMFKRSDAWGNLVMRGKTRNSYRLNL